MMFGLNDMYGYRTGVQGTTVFQINEFIESLNKPKIYSIDGYFKKDIFYVTDLRI